MSSHNIFRWSVCVTAFVAIGSVTTVRAAQQATWNILTPTGTYDWNVNANPPWDTALFPNAVGDIALLNVNYANNQNISINLNQTITLGSMSIGDSGSGTDRPVVINTGSGGTGFVFDNGTGTDASFTKISAGSTITINPNITIPATTPNFSVTSTAGTLIFNGSLLGSTNLNLTGSGSDIHINGDISGFTGTYNIDLGGSTVTFQGTTLASQDGSQAKFIVNNGVANGTLRWAENTVDTTPTVFKMGELSGNATLRNEGNHPTTLQIGALNTSSEFAGIIANGGQPPTFPGTTAEQVSVEKVGSGILTFSGANIYQGTTTVTAGTLRVNGTHEAGGVYIVASGGALGGTGTINSSTGGGDNPNLNAGVTVQAGGKLAPGASAGTLHMDLGTGTLDISGAVTASTSQSMQFELDAVGASDQVQLLNSTNLNIGSGKLEFNDFAFTNLGGLTADTYTLFDSSTPITGTLGSSLSGTIGSFNATISLGDGGNDIVLTTTPGSLAGDYNGDGKMNAADYVLWRKSPATYGGNPAGYNAWRANFGAGGPGAGNGFGAGAIPEPTTLVLLAVATMFYSIGIRRSRGC